MKIENKIEFIKRELRFYNLKIWGILFLFSFLVLGWMSLFPEGVKLGYSGSKYLVLPIFLTMAPWLLWSMYQLTILKPRNSDRNVRNYLRDEIYDFDNEHDEQTSKRLYYEYEGLTIALFKLKKVSKLIEILISIEFFLLLFVVIYFFMLIR